MNTEEAVLKCLRGAIKILRMQEESSDYQALLLRDISVLTSELSAYVHNNQPPKDNVVMFKLEGSKDENEEV